VGEQVKKVLTSGKDSKVKQLLVDNFCSVEFVKQKLADRHFFPLLNAALNTLIDMAHEFTHEKYLAID